MIQKKRIVRWTYTLYNFHQIQNCKIFFRCLNCIIDHDPGVCPLNVLVSDENGKLIKKLDSQGKVVQKTDDKGVALKANCVLCGEQGHPANWKGCKTYQDMIKRKEDRSKEVQKQRELNTKYINNYINKDVPFSNLFSNNRYDNNQFPPISTRRNQSSNTQTNQDHIHNKDKTYQRQGHKTNGQDEYNNYMNNDYNRNADTNIECNKGNNKQNALTYIENECM